MAMISSQSVAKGRFSGQVTAVTIWYRVPELTSRINLSESVGTLLQETNVGERQ